MPARIRSPPSRRRSTPPRPSAGKAIDPAEMVISGLPIAKFFEKTIPEKALPDGRGQEELRQSGRRAGQSGRQGPRHLDGQAHCQRRDVRLNMESGVLKAILDLLPAGGGERFRRELARQRIALGGVAGREPGMPPQSSRNTIPDPRIMTAPAPLPFSTTRTHIAGLPVEDLARQFGTPTYVYDAAMILAAPCRPGGLRPCALRARRPARTWPCSICSAATERWSMRSARARSAGPWPPAIAAAGHAAADRLHGRHLRRRGAGTVRRARAST